MHKYKDLSVKTIQGIARSMGESDKGVNIFDNKVYPCPREDFIAWRFLQDSGLCNDEEDDNLTFEQKWGVGEDELYNYYLEGIGEKII